MIRFDEKVYQKLRKVPKGKITTYKEIARSLGTKAYRRVGQALKNNPYAPVVPCHRVVASDGTIGGFGGKKSGTMITRKMDMLKEEGIKFKGKYIKNFDDVLFRF